MSAIQDARDAGFHVILWSGNYERSARVLPHSGSKVYAKCTQHMGVASLTWKNCHFQWDSLAEQSISQAERFGSAIHHAVAIAREWDAERAGKEWRA